jgi:hypothetical protein
MDKDKEFALLLGRAFLREVDEGHTESAVAFGRAFLLAMGMRGPETEIVHTPHRSKAYGEHLAMVVN